MKTLSLNSRWLNLLCALALLAGCWRGQSQTNTNIAIYPIAVSGNPAPETLGTYGSVDEFAINRFGDVAFQGVTTDHVRGIWTAPRAQPMQLVATNRMVAPGLLDDNGNPVFFDSFDFDPYGTVEPRLDSAGNAVFEAEAGQGTIEGIWSEAGGLAPVASQHGSAFNTYSNQSPQFGIEAVNGGLVLFHAVLGLRAGLFRADLNGAIEIMALDGDNAPGTAAQFLAFGRAVTTQGGRRVGAVMNRDGRVAFLASLQGSGVSDTNDLGIWKENQSSGTLELIARKGSPAPGTTNRFADDPSSFYPESALSNPTINDAGEIAFHGYLSDGNEGLWRGTSASNLQLVAASGRDTVTTVGTVQFAGFSRPVLAGIPMITNAVYPVGPTDLVFHVSTVDPNTGTFDGLWRQQDGVLKPIARGDEAAPGTLGARFVDFFQFAVNARADVVFDADLQGGDVIESKNDTGLWFASSDGHLTLIARTGEILGANMMGTNLTIDAFATASGQSRSSSTEEGSPQWLADDDDVFFDANFRPSGNGLFRATFQLSLPFRLTPIGFQTNGAFALTLTGPPEQTNVVEASTNLQTWTPIETNYGTNYGPPFVFTDPSATNYPNRFYRTRKK